jgi:hypothetical protein
MAASSMTVYHPLSSDTTSRRPVALVKGYYLVPESHLDDSDTSDKGALLKQLSHCQWIKHRIETVLESRQQNARLKLQAIREALQAPSQTSHLPTTTATTEEPSSRAKGKPIPIYPLWQHTCQSAEFDHCPHNSDPQPHGAQDRRGQRDIAVEHAQPTLAQDEDIEAGEHHVDSQITTSTWSWPDIDTWKKNRL